MGLLALVAPLASAALIDDVIPSAQSHLLVQLGILLFVVAVSQSLFAVARNQLVLRIQDKMDLAIQAAIWDRVLNLPITFFRDYSVADLAARVNSINAMHRMLSVGTMTSLLNGLFSFLSFIVLFRFSAPLAFTALALLAGAGLALFIFGWLTLRVLKNMVASQRRINNLILQFLQGVAKLRATASEARAFSIWAKESTHMRDIALKILKLRTVERVFFSGYEHAGTVALFAVRGALIGADSHRTLSAGEFVGFYAAFVNVFQGTLGICQTLVGLMMLVPLYQMAKSILQAVPEDDAGKTHPGTLSGAIEVSQVYFSYPDGEPVLANVSLQVRPGSFTAIVGPSGSGKSTLLRLLLGFEMPTSGAVLYDDKNLQDLNLRAVRQQFGVVLQNSQLMGGDIFSNIAGTSNASIDDAWDAARQSGLDADVQLMPMGMHTAIGEGSSTLSGGQRQRVLISRALVGRPRILYFDEATSALDNRSQAVVSESLMRLKTTRIVVAHRLSTVIHADQIIVLDGGQIVEAGSYAELMEKNGLFAELARRQLAEAA